MEQADIGSRKYSLTAVGAIVAHPSSCRAYGPAELSGVGTTISGLRPAPPASVAADGIVASLNAGPVMVANPGIGEATLLPEDSVASRAAAVGLQPPVMTDVPNEEAADGLAPGGSCGGSIPVDPTALLASSVVLGIAAPMPVVEHVVIVPMGLPEFGPKTPRLNCIAPSGVAAVPAISGIALRVLIGNVIFIADALRGAVDPTCAKLELALNNTTVAITEIKLRIDTSCV